MMMNLWLSGITARCIPYHCASKSSSLCHNYKHHTHISVDIYVIYIYNTYARTYLQYIYIYIYSSYICTVTIILILILILICQLEKSPRWTLKISGHERYPSLRFVHSHVSGRTCALVVNGPSRNAFWCLSDVFIICCFTGHDVWDKVKSPGTVMLYVDEWCQIVVAFVPIGTYDFEPQSSSNRDHIRIFNDIATITYRYISAISLCQYH